MIMNIRMKIRIIARIRHADFLRSYVTLVTLAYCVTSCGLIVASFSLLRAPVLQDCLNLDFVKG